MGNRADADECFQEAFLAALEVARRGPVRRWRALLPLLAAARAVDRLRRRLRRGRHEPVADWDSIRGPGPTPERSAEDAGLASRLREALGRLLRKQAEAFCLSSSQGWSYREIASHLAVSTDSVGVLLHRARKHLQRLLAEPLAVPKEARPGPDAGPTRPREEPS